MASSIHTSRLIIPDPEIEEFEGTLMSPRSKLVTNDESVNGGCKFTILKFNNGFLAETDHKWGYSLESTQMKIFMILPKPTGTHSYTVLDSRIQLVSFNQVQTEFSLHFVKDEDFEATQIKWKAVWQNLDGFWNDSIDEIRIVFKVERQEKGICEISLESLNSNEEQINYKELFLSLHLSDVTLECKGEEFPAHRFILSDCSKGFKEMFRMNRMKIHEGRVVIEDMEPNVLKELLRFMYYGEVESVDNEMCVGLFAAADKYAIHSLKLFCEREIGERIDVDNALDVFIIADVYDSTILKEKAMDITRKYNGRTSLNRKLFAPRHPDVAFQLLLKHCRRPIIHDRS